MKSSYRQSLKMLERLEQEWETITAMLSLICCSRSVCLFRAVLLFYLLLCLHSIHLHPVWMYGCCMDEFNRGVYCPNLENTPALLSFFWVVQHNALQTQHHYTHYHYLKLTCQHVGSYLQLLYTSNRHAATLASPLTFKKNTWHISG